MDYFEADVARSQMFTEVFRYGVRFGFIPI